MVNNKKTIMAKMCVWHLPQFTYLLTYLPILSTFREREGERSNFLEVHGKEEEIAKLNINVCFLQGNLFSCNFKEREKIWNKEAISLYYYFCR